MQTSEQGNREWEHAIKKTQGTPTERQKADAESGAAFGAAARSGARRKDDPTAPRAAGCNPSAHQVEEQRVAKALQAAIKSGTIRRDNPGAPKYSGCGYTPHELESKRAAAAFKHAVDTAPKKK